MNKSITAAGAKRKVSFPQILGMVLILGSLILIGYQATSQESSVTFYTPEEVFKEQAQFVRKRFRMGGLVLAGTKVWKPESKQLSFVMTDLKGHDFQVLYKGIPPDLFKEGQGVVVEGRLTQGASALAAGPTGAVLASPPPQKPMIHASLLMVKHSEVYDEKKDHSQMREARLLDSLLKDQGKTGE